MLSNTHTNTKSSLISNIASRETFVPNLYKEFRESGINSNASTSHYQKL